jgi:Helix-turn-helix domain
MPTVAHLSSTPQASRELEAEGSWARGVDRRRVLLLYQQRQPARAPSTIAWALPAAPAPWEVGIPLDGCALYTVYAVAADPSYCAEPQETYQVRSRQAGHWCWLNNVVIDHHARFLGPEALSLYTYLARHADNTTQECWPTIPRMVQSTGMSRNRVRKALKRLAAYGLITLEERVIAYYDKVWRGSAQPITKRRGLKKMPPPTPVSPETKPSPAPRSNATPQGTPLGHAFGWSAYQKSR